MSRNVSSARSTYFKDSNSVLHASDPMLTNKPMRFIKNSANDPNVDYSTSTSTDVRLEDDGVDAALSKSP